MEDLRHLVFGESSLLIDCYPGGNDTYLFHNPGISRRWYPKAQGLIRSRYPHFEQGGFFECARSRKAVARVQTPGGEFSPNVARSAAALLAELFCRDRTLLPIARWGRVTVTRECLLVPLEVSGSRDVLQAAVWAGAKDWQVELELMRTSGLRVERGVPLLLAGRKYHCDIVLKGGVAQVLFSERDVPLGSTRAAVVRHIGAVRQQLGLHSRPVFGVAWWKEHEGKFSIRPVSHLSGNDMCRNETACGAAAVALALAQHDGRSRADFAVTQPSGEDLRVRIQPGLTRSSPCRVFLTGPVQLRGELHSSFCDIPQDCSGGLRRVR